MRLLDKLRSWWKRERELPPLPYDVNAQNDFARRAMYPELTDEEYRRRFHPER